MPPMLMDEAAYGAVLNEANVERVFSFSSLTLSDRRTTLGAAIFEAFVVVGFNWDASDLTPELVEEVLQDYYSILDSTGDHDTDDPTEEKEEDADDDEQMADAGAVPAATQPAGAAPAVAAAGATATAPL